MVFLDTCLVFHVVFSMQLPHVRSTTRPAACSQQQALALLVAHRHCSDFEWRAWQLMALPWYAATVGVLRLCDETVAAGRAGAAAAHVQAGRPRRAGAAAVLRHMRGEGCPKAALLDIMICFRAARSRRLA